MRNFLVFVLTIVTTIYCGSPTQCEEDWKPGQVAISNGSDYEITAWFVANGSKYPKYDKMNYVAPGNRRRLSYSYIENGNLVSMTFEKIYLVIARVKGSQIELITGTDQAYIPWRNISNDDNYTLETMLEEDEAYQNPIYYENREYTEKLVARVNEKISYGKYEVKQGWQITTKSTCATEIIIENDRLYPRYHSNTSTQDSKRMTTSDETSIASYNVAETSEDLRYVKSFNEDIKGVKFHIRVSDPEQIKASGVVKIRLKTDGGLFAAFFIRAVDCNGTEIFNVFETRKAHFSDKNYLIDVPVTPGSTIYLGTHNTRYRWSLYTPQ